MRLSIIIPICDEQDNILPLYNSLIDVLNQIGESFEIVIVNDGSHDASEEILNNLGDKDSHVKVIHLRRNYGQTQAMMAGLAHSSGDIIIAMDGDNQNDPVDIPRLMAKLDEGYDVVSGWRKERKDSLFYRVIPSKIANWLISLIGGVKLHDYGCTLKVYRKEIIKDLRLYGEMHRFIPIYASWHGASVTELAVNHRPRLFGKSKYGFSRVWVVILDLILIKFLDRYMQSPIHLFGGFGLCNFLLAFLTFGLMLCYKYWWAKTFTETPLPILIVFFLLVGFMAILMGFVAEMVVRTYYESQDKKTYTIKKIIN